MNNLEKIKTISDGIFELSRLHPNRVKVCNPKLLGDPKELEKYGYHFDSSFNNVDSKIIEKMKDFLEREEKYNNIYIYPSVSGGYYDLYTNK